MRCEALVPILRICAAQDKSCAMVTPKMDEDETLRISLLDIVRSGMASQRSRLCCRSWVLEALKLTSHLAPQLSMERRSASKREHKLDLGLGLLRSVIFVRSMAFSRLIVLFERLSLGLFATIVNLEIIFELCLLLKIFFCSVI